MTRHGNRRDKDESKDYMDRSFKAIMDVYEHQKLKWPKNPDWKHPRHHGTTEPHPLTVTHVNQTHTLHHMDNTLTGFRDCQSSDEWLEKHSIEKKGLLLKELIRKGKICRPEVLECNKLQQKLSFDAQDINEFELSLNYAINEYTERIKWLLQDSRRMFGLVQGRKVAVLLDCSDANSGFGRLANLQESLMHFIENQLSNKDKIYIASFGSNVDTLWPEVVNVNRHTLDQAKSYVDRLSPMGGCNLLKAIKHILSRVINGIDSLVIVCGSAPDQSAEIISSFLSQSLIGRKIKLTTVAFDCSDQTVTTTLRIIAETGYGRYQCYASTCEESIYTGTDISRLLTEIQRAQDVINKIGEMKEGLLGTALIQVMSDINSEISRLPQSRLLPQPPNHADPLNIQQASRHVETSSVKWLEKHGLRPQKLDLYQILAPNSYSYCEQFVPILSKTVQSQVHEKSMIQCHWHDGTIKNVHVDLSQLYDYQKRLGTAVKLYEKRIEWLVQSSMSRALFGTIVEKSIIICFDISASNAPYLVHIQHSLRLLLEQQLPDNKEYFNVIAFGSMPKQFRPTVVKPTPENLQLAWKWILEQQADGSRNLLSALRSAFETSAERDHSINVEGIYIMTSGIPDQHRAILASYAQEECVGRNSHVHVILFNVDDYNADGAIPSRYANINATADCLRALAHATDGRFHWFRETGVIESDDVSVITAEINKALNFSEKCAVLVKSVKKLRHPIENAIQYSSHNETKEQQAPPLPSIKPPACATTSGNYSRPQSSKVKKVIKAGDQQQKPKAGKKMNDQQLTATLNDSAKELQECTVNWLRKYGLKKLKLDIDCLLQSAHDCKHQRALSRGGKLVKTRTCVIFPTVNVKGSLRHLHLLPHELDTYVDKLIKVLRFYGRRLQWLLASSRRIFSIIREKNIVILLDSSGSMTINAPHLLQSVSSLLWEQLSKHEINFTLKTFDDTVRSFHASLLPATVDNCEEAINWLKSIIPSGNTCTLEALQDAYKLKPDAIYLLTDGKPDCSTAKILDYIHTNAFKVPIHTISFACDDEMANGFLQQIARLSNGRYHKSIINDSDPIDLVAHKLANLRDDDDADILDTIKNIEFPNIEGENLSLLIKEITKCQQCISQAKTFKDLYINFNNETEQLENN